MDQCSPHRHTHTLSIWQVTLNQQAALRWEIYHAVRYQSLMALQAFSSFSFSSFSSFPHHQQTQAILLPQVVGDEGLHYEEFQCLLKHQVQHQVHHPHPVWKSERRSCKTNAKTLMAKMRRSCPIQVLPPNHWRWISIYIYIYIFVYNPTVFSINMQAQVLFCSFNNASSCPGWGKGASRLPPWASIVGPFSTPMLNPFCLR